MKDDLFVEKSKSQKKITLAGFSKRGSQILLNNDYKGHMSEGDSSGSIIGQKCTLSS